MTPPGYTSFEHAGWRGYHSPEGASLVGGDDLVTHALTPLHETIHDRTGASVYRVETPEAGPVYLKHFKGLKNHPEGKKPKPTHRVKWRLIKSRAVHTLMISEAMRAADLLTPRVLLAARQIRGLDAEDVLVTQPIEGVCLIDRLYAADTAEARRLLELAGAEIARLHRAGFVHGDCLPMNVFVTPDEQRLVFFDNDRTQQTTRGYTRNLAQFTYYLILVLGYMPTMTFVNSYDRARGETNKGIRRKRWTGVLNSVGRRAAHEFLPDQLDREELSPRG